MMGADDVVQEVVVWITSTVTRVAALNSSAVVIVSWNADLDVRRCRLASTTLSVSTCYPTISCVTAVAVTAAHCVKSSMMWRSVPQHLVRRGRRAASLMTAGFSASVLPAGKVLAASTRDQSRPRSMLRSKSSSMLRL